MTIEVAILISVVSVAFAIYFGINNLRRGQKADDKNDATQLTMVIVKLENIGMGISEIKSEMSNLKNDMREDRERIVKMETKMENCEKNCKYKKGEI